MLIIERINQMLNSEKTTMPTKKISIIIPCYNCENTIDYCLNAVITQTIGIQNLEIILINDASTDSTLSKLYEYEKKYPDTILVINCTENGRQGTARNIGLSYATGEYVAYVDDDDVMEQNMYELLYLAAKQTNAEVIVSINKSTSEVPCLDSLQNNTLLLKCTKEIQTTKARSILLADRSINNAVWNKLYQRQFLINNDIHFAEHIIYEDILFTMLMKTYVSKLCILDNVFYYHVMTSSSSSIGSAFNEERIFHYLGVHAETIEELKKRNKYTPYQFNLLNWYTDAYISCAVWYVYYNGKISPEYLSIMDNSVEQLFPGKVDFEKLHKQLLQNIQEKLSK